MPYCAFQHTMTSLLNIVIIDHAKSVNAEDRYSGQVSPMNLVTEVTVIPAPIAEYFSMISNATTPQGDNVLTNIPVGGVPNPHIAAAGDVVEQTAGGFGVCGVANHNSYECYVSPLITSRLVEATLQQNQDHNFADWEPLPAGMTPPNGVPNRNLLGYRQVERLRSEGIQTLMNLQFPDGDNMSSRIRWCSELNCRVYGVLRTMENRYKMAYGKPRHGTNTSTLGYMSVISTAVAELQWNTQRVADFSGPIYSSVALGSWQTYQVYLFGLKRERTDHARGFCYTGAAGIALPGWIETMNSNFTMVAPFSPTIGYDMPDLRVARHMETTPIEHRPHALIFWLTKNFIIKKDVKKQG